MPFFAALGTALGASAASAATVGALATAGLAATGAGLGYTVASGEAGKKAQSEAMRQQAAAQQQQIAQAAMQQRRSEQAIAGAQRREPNVQAIMASAQEAASGPSSTMLTGPMGVNPADLQLGRSTLLGG